MLQERRRHATKFINPATDGAVLPILHLNGCEISNPTLVARIFQTEDGSLKSRQTRDVSITKESQRHN